MRRGQPTSTRAPGNPPRAAIPASPRRRRRRSRPPRLRRVRRRSPSEPGPRGQPRRRRPAMPASRSRAISAAVAGMAAARYGWCRKSSVPASSRSGWHAQRGDQQRRPGRVGRGERRAGLAAGSTWRATSVASGSAGMQSTGVSPGSGVSRGGLDSSRGRSRRCSARRTGKRPRYRDVLRARWPAAAAASGGSACAPAEPASARAASTPATMAAADEPRPKPCGTSFLQKIARPGGCAPIAANAARMARMTRCPSSRSTAVSADAGGLPPARHRASRWPAPCRTG